MLRTEQENCTFEPEAGSLNPHLELALKVMPNLKKEGYTDEPDPEKYFKNLGTNFAKSHPEVYKSGVLKRARLKFMNGKYEEAMNTLFTGFNVESLKKKMDLNYRIKEN
jgi:hypothetical protein